MAYPQQFEPHYQSQDPQSSKEIRNVCVIDDKIPQQVGYFTKFQDQTQHPPYVPSFHVEGFAPGPVAHQVTDGVDEGVDFQWNYGVEPKRKKLKEQDLLEGNNSQLSSVDFFQPGSVSTGLGLSLSNSHISFYGKSALLSLVGDEADHELLRQDVEIDRFLKLETERMRQNILQKFQMQQLQTMSSVQEKVLQNLRQKEVEVENINKKNMELEERMEQLSVQAGTWQQIAMYNENMINALKFNLQQVYAQSRDSKEECGDSEVDDTASCCNGRYIDFHLLCKENNDMRDLICKVCKVKQVSMLLLPCKHLCLCKDCESKLSFCPLCQSTKFIGMEVFM